MSNPYTAGINGNRAVLSLLTSCFYGDVTAHAAWAGRRCIGAVLALLFHVLTTFCAKQEVVAIPSASMKTAYNATVIIPDSYDDSVTQRYPSVYFLHGYSGDFSTWPAIAPLRKFADAYQMIFVCPDGGYNSWYYDSPITTESKFETYIVFEVVGWIDSVYRTTGSRTGRALVGSSMGGHGALFLLIRHPDRYAGASSISGVLDITEFSGHWDIARVLGEYHDNKTLWQNHSVLGLAGDTLKNSAIMLDCGTRDFALPGNRRTHRKLKECGVAHEYHEESGDHSPAYVRSRVEYHIRYFSNIVR